MSDAVETESTESSEPVQSEQPEQVGPQDQGNDEFKSEESKQAVLADLKAERERRKALQAQVEQFEQAQAEAEKANMTELERAQAEANEYKSEAEKRTRQLSVYQLAMDKGLTDQDDIALLEEVESDEAREKLAQRLADRNSAPNNPKPDLTQGASGKHTPPSNAEIFAQQLGDF